jgi:hypothetical protein
MWTARRLEFREQDANIACYGEALPCSHDPLKQRGKSEIVTRPDDEVKEWESFQEGGTIPLGNTSAKDKQTFAPLSLPGFHEGEASKGALLSGASHAAGVKEDEFGVVVIRHFLPARLAQNVPHPFRITHIHLAAEGMYNKSFHNDL